ncbi:hypothetical protein EDC04DRAFT_2830326 [Pisolithus marmoratus]|nr:hypothetical protein EDC04DRAFT_2830326 [Pisolithus marmoratus]
MAPGLCENCHKKPKFGTHKYCGQTCASQATVSKGPVRSQPKASSAGNNRAAPPGIPQKAIQLCDYCRKNPKFTNFDYCSKSCAALATRRRVTKQLSRESTPQDRTHLAFPTRPRMACSRTSHNVTKAPQGKVLVSQDDPSDEEECDKSDEETGTDLSAYPTDSDEDEPVIAAPQPVKPGNSSMQSSQIAPGTCAMPHCGKPVHMDKSGVKTNYCGTLGLEAPCIMCKRYPQSGSDYFCSSSCRNQSMAKT